MARTTTPDQDKVYYFAFGSNMCEWKMRDRLGSRWSGFSSTPGILHGWRLAFNVVGFPAIGEPSFASIGVCPEGSREGVISPVCGIIYEMDRATFEYLAVTEDVGRMYSVAELDVECLCPNAPSERIKCLAFVVTQRTENASDNAIMQDASNDAPCSKRYRDILVSGSRLCALPEWYIAMLETRIPYVDYGWMVNTTCALLVRGIFFYYSARDIIMPSRSDKEISICVSTPSLCARRRQSSFTSISSGMSPSFNE
eukprot:GEMP01012655.1.p1 GENE.GEMP01012655.1~~GEMP01012655.1.p1  ORF type:complete len:255 (+),score=37.14 GEMP01012655.1:157-921(+)